MYSCPICGAPVAFGVRFCDNCGTPLNWQTQQQSQPPPVHRQPQQQSSSWLVVSIALAAIVLLVGGGIFAFNTISQKTPPSTVPPTGSPPASDVIAPTITNVEATSVTETGAFITWTTDEPASSEVEYSQAAGHPALPVTKTALVVNHSITLSDLFPDTEYKYRVKSRDSSGNEAISDYYTFITAERYTYHDYYPIILSLSDDKGNVIKTSRDNHYVGPYGSSATNTSLKIGDKISWTIEAKDPKGRQLLYRWNSNSQRFNALVGYKWNTSSQLDYTITPDDLKTAGEILRIVGSIKSEKEYLRSPGNEDDDSAFLDYKLLP